MEGERRGEENGMERRGGNERGRRGREGKERTGYVVGKVYIYTCIREVGEERLEEKRGGGRGGEGRRGEG